MIEKVVREDFPYWTGGRNELTMKQVGLLERNTEIRGQQAATLGLLGQFFVGQIKNDYGREPAFALEDLLTRLKTRDMMHQRFIVVMQELTAEAASRHQLQLYGSGGHPSEEGIRQAGLGDCFALSAIEVVLHCWGPIYIEKLIQQDGESRFTVSLPGGHPVTVNLTDAEICQGNLSPENGCWLQVLGIAIERLKIENAPRAKTSMARTKQLQSRQTPLGSISVGGSQRKVLDWLTGNPYGVVGRKGRFWNPRVVVRVLTAAAEHNVPLGTCTPDHCCSIFDWDPRARVITIKNPWGTSGNYTPNHADKFHMDNGKFDVTIEQFLQNFSSICLPLSLKARVLG